MREWSLEICHTHTHTRECMFVCLTFTPVKNDTKPFDFVMSVCKIRLSDFKSHINIDPSAQVTIETREPSTSNLKPVDQ